MRPQSFNTELGGRQLTLSISSSCSISCLPIQRKFAIARGSTQSLAASCIDGGDCGGRAVSPVHSQPFYRRHQLSHIVQMVSDRGHLNKLRQTLKLTYKRGKYTVAILHCWVQSPSIGSGAYNKGCTSGALHAGGEQ